MPPPLKGMKTHLSQFDALPHLHIFRVEFDPLTFCNNDLLWLPHHERLSSAATKRKAEHLAGRIAACEALNFYGITDYVPGIGLHREPCWPPGFIGSITHTGNMALATVMPDDPQLRVGIGIDCEEIMAPKVAQDIYGSIIDSAEKELLTAFPFPFNYSLTLVFSAKESLFKALFRHVGRYFDFSAASINKIDDKQVMLILNHSLGPYKKGTLFKVIWRSNATQLITLIQFE